MARQVCDEPPPAGAPAFRRAVRRVVRAIPFGGLASYAQVAARAGRPGAGRMVGPALGEDLPWWRVVRSDGTLALGERQAKRLRAEGVEVLGSRVAGPASRRWLRGGSEDAP